MHNESHHRDKANWKVMSLFGRQELLFCDVAFVAFDRTSNGYDIS